MDKQNSLDGWLGIRQGIAGEFPSANDRSVHDRIGHLAYLVEVAQLEEVEVLIGPVSLAVLPLLLPIDPVIGGAKVHFDARAVLQEEHPVEPLDGGFETLGDLEFDLSFADGIPTVNLGNFVDGGIEGIFDGRLEVHLLGRPAVVAGDTRDLPPTASSQTSHSEPQSWQYA